MKKLFLITLALVSFQINAQDKKLERMNKFADFTPEEIAQLQTKKMTLYLDLNKSQQKQIEKINLENAIERKAKMESVKLKRENNNAEKLSKNKRLAMMNARLDKQIEMKQKMKQILNAEQFEKWEGFQNKRNKRMHARKKSKK